MNFEKAIEFIRKNGDEVEQARLDYLLTLQRPAEQIVGKLFAGQRADGGWPPFWAEKYSSLDATCFRLARAEQLGITSADIHVSKAIKFLAKRQAPEGSWEEESAVGEAAPPWVKPGELSARLYLTSNCGFWLALLGKNRDGASKAAGYLRANLDEVGHLPSFPHTDWLAGALWHKVGWQEPRDKAFVYLGQRLNHLAPSNFAWLITSLCAAGVSPDHPLVTQAVLRLEQNQSSNGSWQGEDGARQDVHATLEALRALSLCGRVKNKPL